ncbi:MAG TPA: hypothetical protein VFR41_12695, partial [Acidimicrobiia bacterium]|nr:hypothetical protein [Acidimicrobiia bacterium]
VLAWGNNASGQLGNGAAPTDRHTPVPVVGLGSGSGVVQIVAGAATSYARRSNGTVLAWGNDGVGELGNGLPRIDQSTPVQVQTLTGVVDISAGDQHALALERTGAVFAWGDNLLGQLGDGTTKHRSAPVPVLGLGVFSGVRAVYAGGNSSHTLATSSPPPSPTTPQSGSGGTPGTTPSSSGVSTGGAPLPTTPRARATVANPTATG